MTVTDFIAHRINQVAALQALPHHLGCEIDLRDRGDRLILQHDPFIDGEDAEPFFAAYRHGTLICNIKSERIESRVQELAARYKIENYFFLDSSLPMIVSLARQGEKRQAVRFSEWESIESVMLFAGRVQWVWVDCFSRLPFKTGDFEMLKAAGFKLCLVSPELQGRPDDIALYRKQLQHDGIVFDAICTKQHNITIWSD